MNVTSAHVAEKRAMNTLFALMVVIVVAQMWALMALAHVIKVVNRIIPDNGA